MGEFDERLEIRRTSASSGSGFWGWAFRLWGFRAHWVAVSCFRGSFKGRDDGRIKDPSDKDKNLGLPDLPSSDP